MRFARDNFISTRVRSLEKYLKISSSIASSRQLILSSNYGIYNQLIKMHSLHIEIQYQIDINATSSININIFVSHISAAFGIKNLSFNLICLI